jgi:tRNA (guanine-N7-)-methyltransferase
VEDNLTFAHPFDDRPNPYDLKLDHYKDFVMRLDSKTKKFPSFEELNIPTQLPLHLEIGPGNGDFMKHFCMAHPHIHLVGIDYCYKRGLTIAKKLSALNQRNFRFIRGWAQYLHEIIPHNTIDCLYYFFPDPWPKARHHKKRLFTPEFLKIIHSILKDDGVMMIKTDHDGLYEWMLEKIAEYEMSSPLKFKIELQSRHLHNEFPHHFLAEFPTQFEKIFMKQGVSTKAIVLKKLN